MGNQTRFQEERRISRLRLARRARDWSVAELSVFSRVSPSSIYRLEQGHGTPNKATQILLAAALDTDPEELSG
jgi:transcriptional regulator with XRE-family HTH domain